MDQKIQTLSDIPLYLVPIITYDPGSQEPRGRKIAELRALVLELRTRLAESEKLRAAREISLLEDGLRLSQENEALRKELAELMKSRNGTGL